MEKYPPKRHSLTLEDQSETNDANDSDRVNLVEEIMKLDPICAKQMGVYELYKK